MTQKDINKLLRRYYQYLKLEKSFSQNTIDAYQRDLQKFFHFIGEKQKNPLEVELEDFHEFSALLHDVGIHPTSLYRILMGVRSF